MSRPNPRKRCPCGRLACAVWRAGYQHPPVPLGPLPGTVTHIAIRDGDSIILTIRPTRYPDGPVAPERRGVIVKVPKRLARIIAAAVEEE